jgi:hypothetical protein
MLYLHEGHIANPGVDRINKGRASLDASIASIIMVSIILMQFSMVHASAEDKDDGLEKAESLVVLASQDKSEYPSSVDAYLNRTNSEPIPSVLGPSNPGESRANWQLGDYNNLNDSTYLDLMALVRTQYMEDLNYSSYILDQFVKKKIDAREAMTSTMALFVLTSETVRMVDQIMPPAKFEEYQNTTQLALINLEGYLWNMVKFYETNRRVYALQAHDNFNKSMSYYNKGSTIAKLR